MCFGKFIALNELVEDKQFDNEINKIGSEILKKTGLEIIVVLAKELPNLKAAQSFCKLQLSNRICLVLIENIKKVDIFQSTNIKPSCYKKETILSPMPGGVIVPLLAARNKKSKSNQYALAVLNGYIQIAENIAQAKGIMLENAIGNVNKNIFGFLRFIFYGVILLALATIIYKRFFYEKR